MKTATVRDLRYGFARIESWLQDGNQVEITKRGQTIARLVPASRRVRKLVKPDIMARLQAIWGERVFTAQEVAEMRAGELGDKG